MNQLPFVLLENQNDYEEFNKFIQDKPLKILGYRHNWVMCSCDISVILLISEWLHDNEKMNHLSSMTQSMTTKMIGYETCVDIPNFAKYDIKSYPTFE